MPDEKQQVNPSDVIKCKYPNCHHRVSQFSDIEFCIFHAPADKKEITVEHFNRIVFAEINKIYNHNEMIKDESQKLPFDFHGCIFPGDITFGDETKPLIFNWYVDFADARLMGEAVFRKVKFSGLANFIGAQFTGGANFREAQFSGIAHFYEAQFSGDAGFFRAQFSGDAHFLKAQFSGIAHFDEAQFSGIAHFYQAQFSGDAGFSHAQFSRDAGFSSAQFSGRANFHGAQFSGIAHFYEVQFSGIAHFYEAQFSITAFFTDMKIRNLISFSNVVLREKCVFEFRENYFIYEGENKSININFKNVRFNPFAAYIENVRLKPEDKRAGCELSMIFRYCQLKDVYFSDNDMSLFSFYKSSYDEARFASSTWGSIKDRVFILFSLRWGFKQVWRKNIIAEEYYYDHMRKNLEDRKLDSEYRKSRGIEDLHDRFELATMYRRMKASLDRSKDFPEAGWFYYNEFEMKRKGLAEKIDRESSSKTLKVIRKVFSEHGLYSIYKTFAGYGGKPLWSFIWFVGFALFFSIIHLFSGLQKSIDGRIINYDFSSITLKSLFTIDFGVHWGYALLFTLYRVIPVSFLPFRRDELFPVGLDGLFWSFLNSLVLIILVTFIAIGLKRHFRRF